MGGNYVGAENWCIIRFHGYHNTKIYFNCAFFDDLIFCLGFDVLRDYFFYTIELLNAVDEFVCFSRVYVTCAYFSVLIFVKFDLKTIR